MKTKFKLHPGKIGASLMLSLIASLTTVHAQSTIASWGNHGYSANAGWLDFRPSEVDGVVVTETYLSGKVYGANIGWIDMGDGSPTNGHTYSNSSATDFGVNLSESGQLTGYAYSANVGWINFEQTHGKPSIDFATGQFHGSAYSANIGWIALETQNQAFFLVTETLGCPDTDQDGIGDAYEMFHFHDLTTANLLTDSDGDGVSDILEYSANTNPLDANSYLRITAHVFNASFKKVALTFTSSANRTYSIEHDTDLVAPWTDSGLYTFSPDLGPSTTRTVEFPTGPRRFFRVLAHKPLQP